MGTSRTLTLIGGLALCAGAAGCLPSPETNQLRTLNEELQRRNVELTAENIALEREIERLRAENQKLKTPPARGTTP